MSRHGIADSYRFYISIGILLLGVSLVATADDTGRGLLWEISKLGMAPSYLFGTIHSEDPEVLALAEPVEHAFSGSNSVVLEVLLDLEAMMYSSTVMLMTDGRLLSDILDESLFRQTAAVMQTRGIPELVLERMKPWAVATALAMPVAETGMVLDMALYQQALEDGKQVYGLETIQEQLDVFEGMSMNDQVALVRDSVEQFPGIEAMHKTLIDAWKERDLAEMLAINEAAMETGDQRMAEEFQRRLVTDRNWRMADRMQPYLKQGKAFVAVGALHLPGEQGLLNLLEQRGYSVRVIY
ncbi:MAG: TraB/GumN family protein [Pseudomonadota bacterium]|nr:TraB/GumN family protein [Pseudomonadota bacterium]